MKRVVFPDMVLPPAYSSIAHSGGTPASSAIESMEGCGRNERVIDYDFSGHTAQQQGSSETMQSGPTTSVGGSSCSGSEANATPGDYVAVEVVSASAGTLKARPIALTTLMEFVAVHGSCSPMAGVFARDTQPHTKALNATLSDDVFARSDSSLLDQVPLASAIA